MFKRLLTELGSWLREPEANDRVMLIADVELFDGGIITKGATGVVVMTCWATDPDQPTGSVLMDQHQPMLAAYGNTLQVWPRKSKHGPVTWSHFKTVTRP